jgi:hypothetical protein
LPFNRWPNFTTATNSYLRFNDLKMHPHNNNENNLTHILKKVKEYATNIEANRAAISRLSKQGEQGRKASGSRNVEATILLSRGSEKFEKIKGREAQQLAIESYAKEEGIWFGVIEEEPADDTEHPGLSTFIDSGAENQVYVSKENYYMVRKAMKTLDPFNKNNPNEVLAHLDKRIAEHNGGLGNSVPYTVIGFGRLSNGEFVVITEQPNVQNARLATMAEIEIEMEKRGYRSEGKYTYVNDNYFLTDINPKNVLVDPEGNFHFIDTMIDPVYEINEDGVEKYW